MTPIEAVEAKLKKYPTVRHKLTRDGIRILAPNPGGFPIELAKDGEEWIVYFGDNGMHDHFASAEDALDFIAFGLSIWCRLREMRRGFVLRKSIVERLEDGNWKFVSTTVVFAPHLRLWSEKIFHNPLIAHGG